MAQLRIWGDGRIGTGIGSAVWNVRTLVTCDWSGGRLFVYPVETGEPEVWGDGYLNPEGIVIDGDVGYITEQGGTLLRQDLVNPGRANAEVLAGGLGAPHQVIMSEDRASVLLADYTGGRILRVTLDAGAVEEVAGGLSRPVGLALTDAGDLLVTEQGTGSLTRVAVDGSRTPVLGGLMSPFFLGWGDAARTELLITERSPVHRVSVFRPATGERDRLVARNISQPSSTVRMGDLLIVTGANRVLALDASGGLRPEVTVLGPAEPLWPGAWADVEIDPGVTGYRREELFLAVEPAGFAGLSDHPATNADPARPSVRLLAGATLGTADLVVRDAATLVELGRSAFSVDTVQPAVDGPPIWIEGPVSAPLPMTLFGDQVGAAEAGLLKPVDRNGTALPSWRVLAVLVDTDDSKWPDTVTPTTPAPTAADAKTTWRDVITGPGSLDTFYRELSANRLGITLVGGAVQGPVHLGGAWKDWFTKDKDTAGWTTNGNVIGKVVSELVKGGTGFDAVDCVFMVYRSAGGNFVWPRAFERAKVEKAKAADGKDIDVKIAQLNMCHNQTTVVGFTNLAVSAHELGHTLGLDDLYMTSGYTDTMKKRDLGFRELMAQEQDLPHLSARHKLVLGFLDPAHIRTFSYLVDADETFDLHPIAAGLPPAGLVSAVELVVARGVSWYFEFRQQQPGKLGDTKLTGRVLGYDAWSYKSPPVMADARRKIILLRDDGDGEGSWLLGGQDYENLDTNDPNRPEVFRLEVLSGSATSAKVRVRVQRVQQPDPSIRNHNEGEYKSPDIEVRTKFSDADKAFLNRPIIGSDNRVVAKVTNIGGLSAPNVTVRFKVLPFNTSASDSKIWQDLGDPVTHDVAAGATVEFETHWIPPGGGHYCMQARIDRYTRVPGAVADEPDLDNNLAQTNYMDIESAPSSPATREWSLVQVENPFDDEVTAILELNQTIAGYRSYLDHGWVRIPAGQTRTVRLEVESLATSIWDAVERQYPDGRTWVKAWLMAPNSHSPRGAGGVALGVSTRVRTEVKLVEHAPGGIMLRVVSPSGAPPAREGTVVVDATYDDGTSEVLIGEVSPTGTVALNPSPVGGRAVVRYSGAPGYGMSEGIEIELDRA